MDHTKSIPPRIHQRRIPSCSRRYPSRESSDLLSVSHTIPSNNQPLSHFLKHLPNLHPFQFTQYLKQKEKETHPKGPSCKHNCGNPIELNAAIFPTQGPFSHPTPVTNDTLFAVDSFARAALALVYAALQSPSPWAARAGDSSAR